MDRDGSDSEELDFEVADAAGALPMAVAVRSPKWATARKWPRLERGQIDRMHTGKELNEAPDTEEIPRAVAEPNLRSLFGLPSERERLALHFLLDHAGVTLMARLPLGDEVAFLGAVGIGGTTLGRPYPSGSYSVSNDGWIAYTSQANEQCWWAVEGHAAYQHAILEIVGADTVEKAAQFEANTSSATLRKMRRHVVLTRAGGNLKPAPADIYLGGPDGVLPLTHLRGGMLPQHDLPVVREINFKSSADGRDIQGWYITPPDFDASKKYPLILEIHGGPFANYGPRFSAEMQLYAAAGYVVFYCNPRGSTSYGEEFGNLIHHAYPGDDYHDLMSGVDAMIDKGFVDPERLYVTGGSGGGVLTAWIVGKTDRFRAAVVAKPVINWASFVLTADASPFFTQYWFPGMHWDHYEHYWKRSPLSLVGNVTIPTMLLTGEEDYRTPISETEQYYAALKLRGVDSVMVRIPGAGHGIATRPSQMIGKVLHVLHWFDSHGGQARQATEKSGP